MTAGHPFPAFCIDSACDGREENERPVRAGGLDPTRPGLDRFVSGSGIYGMENVEGRTRGFVKRLEEYERRSGVRR
jgi:hypothetical protein